MRYIDQRLFEGETIVHRGDFPGVHKFWAWAALIGLGIVLIGIFIFIAMMVHFRTTEFCVTSRLIILKRGLFTADMTELELDAIEGAQLHQSFWGRVFGYGEVEVRGRGDTDIHFPTMADPGAFVAAIEEARMNGEAVHVTDNIKLGLTD